MNIKDSIKDSVVELKNGIKNSIVEHIEIHKSKKQFTAEMKEWRRQQELAELEAAAAYIHARETEQQIVEQFDGNMKKAGIHKADIAQIYNVALLEYVVNGAYGDLAMSHYILGYLDIHDEVKTIIDIQTGERYPVETLTLIQNKKLVLTKQYEEGESAAVLCEPFGPEFYKRYYLSYDHEVKNNFSYPVDNQEKTAEIIVHFRETTNDMQNLEDFKPLEVDAQKVR